HCWEHQWKLKGEGKLPQDKNQHREIEAPRIMEELNAVLQIGDHRIEVLPIGVPLNGALRTGDHPNAVLPIKVAQKEAVSLPVVREKERKEAETLPRKIPTAEIILTEVRKIAVPIAVIEETDPREIDQIPLRIKTAAANVLK
ncbi:MAG TPA: hypothetical protein DIW81_03855, partial [Planctomycetaceae bacterium]|nr:hypothetical protein [Planctomycetaceae bacterium]